MVDDSATDWGTVAVVFPLDRLSGEASANLASSCPISIGIGILTPDNSDGSAERGLVAIEDFPMPGTGPGECLGPFGLDLVSASGWESR